MAPMCIPINGAEAICNAKLVKALNDNGYIIDVISRDIDFGNVVSSFDEQFVKSINTLNIIPATRTLNFKAIRDHLLIFFKTGYVYKGAHWAYHAICSAENLIKHNKYDYILTRHMPSEIVGLYISKKYGLKWIANWNDPFPAKRYPQPYGYGPKAKLPRNTEKLLRNICLNADLHTFPCERLRDYMLQYMYGVKKDKTRIIPHICLEDLFERSLRIKSDKLLLVHSGNVSHPRNPETFLKGVKMFIEQIGQKRDIEIFFVGKQDADFKEKIIKYKLESIVTLVGQKTYIDNLKFISSCDVAIIIEAICEEGIYLPTKVGDYMQCGIDIFAISPKVGTLNDLYKKGAVKFFADVENPTAICAEFNKVLELKNQYKNGSIHSKIYPEYSSEKILSIYNDILT